MEQLRLELADFARDRDWDWPSAIVHIVFCNPRSRDAPFRFPYHFAQYLQWTRSHYLELDAQGPSLLIAAGAVVDRSAQDQFHSPRNLALALVGEALGKDICLLLIFAMLVPRFRGAAGVSLPRGRDTACMQPA